jgi:hypothetical protein
MDRLLSILEKRLPGAKSKTILGMSIAVPSVLYALYPDLPASWLAPTEEERFLWRLLVPISLMLFGAIALIISLVFHINQKQKNDLINTDILHKEFGVYWDSEQNMYCLSCKKPLKNSSYDPSIFFCSDPTCNSKYPLKDNDGTILTKFAAIKLMTKK